MLLDRGNFEAWLRSEKGEGFLSYKRPSLTSVARLAPGQLDRVDDYDPTTIDRIEFKLSQNDGAAAFLR